ncbi:MAG TPA: hypothetical protein VN948_04905 [Terriglobales bacterium]|nr:hypothetical protein [Terriglobales bacterium]
MAATSLGEFLEQHASAVFGLVGALGGGLLSFFASWLMRKRDYDLQLWGKLLERRIEAHERVIQIALEMRVMIPLGGVDGSGEVLRAPEVLCSKEAFENWFHHVKTETGPGSTWLSVATTRELNFVQDYLVTLFMHLVGVPTERYPQAGVVVRQDFIDLSSQLERQTFSFFVNDVRRLKLKDLREWHKYPREETERRLKMTRLLQQWQDIARLSDRS